jgi:hypothetical protein
MTPIKTTGLSHTEQTHLLSLVQVLLPHPAGLRRWSVMRAIRAQHEKARVEISFKLEDEIEKVFRRLGGDTSDSAGSDAGAQSGAASRLFYRPKDRAGEVWAVDADIARTWLKGIGTIEPRQGAAN